ncbi:MAG TPA: hypothetical protein PKV43_13435 [Armatimonadota bacterium]|nr:hypothetical protein [Armatimonadota bacterium]
MREDLLIKSLRVGLAVLFVLGVLTVPTIAQDRVDLLPFPRSVGTITLTDTELTISPTLAPGPITFNVVNQSSSTRGVVVTGLDRANTPIIRYSMMLSPGGSTTMEFWLFPGNVYTFRDYTSRRIIDDQSDFTSTYSTQVTIPTPFPLGAGPQYDQMTGAINITSTGIQVSPMTPSLGPIIFTVANQTNRARGIVITGQDRTGSDIIRFTRLIPPGQTTRMHFWLYEGQTYIIRDYTSRSTVGGQLRFNTTFSTAVNVQPGSPTGF